jgi:hypothetical protein
MHDPSNSVATAACEKDNSLFIKKTTPLLIGAYVGEFRIMKINLTNSYNQFLRHYENINNNKWTNTLNVISIINNNFNVQPNEQYTINPMNLK